MDPFSLPENISELSADDLTSLRDAALAEFQSTYETKPRTAAVMARMRELASHIETIKSTLATVSNADSDADALASTVLATDSPPVEDDEEEETPPASADTPSAPLAADDPEAEPASAEPASDPGRPTPEPTPAEEPAPAPEPEPEQDPETPESTPDPEAPPADDEPAGLESETEETATVAASTPPSAGTPSATALNAHRDPADSPEPSPATLETARPAATIVAAANVPSVTVGSELDMLDVAKAFNAQARTFPKGQRGMTMRAGVAVIQRSHPDDLTIRDAGDSLDVLDRAVDQSRLPEGNLIAAGGWCAPSETMYDLVTHEEVSGILSIPSVGVTRGGIRHTLGPDFRTIYDGTGFTFTEDDDIAGDYQPDASGTGKPCAVIPCPDFTEDRLDVAGLCITGGILQDVAYPEITKRFIDGALVGHAHRINSLLLENLVAGSDAVSPTAFGGYTVSLLSALELVGLDMKYRERMGENTILEVVLPVWAKGLVRADLSNRLGVELLKVTDAMIAEWMRERKVAVQFVYDWQDDMIDGSGFGGETAITAWPDTVDFLIYPAGTWVKGESDVITIDAIYDSVNLPQNNYTALFTEEGYMTMKRSHDSRVVTVTGFGPMGDANSGSTT